MPRKTQMEIVVRIGEFIKTSGKEQFFKSDFREVGVQPDTAGDWCEIIHYCQTKIPPIRIMKLGRNVIIEVLEQSDQK